MKLELTVEITQREIRSEETGEHPLLYEVELKKNDFTSWIEFFASEEHLDIYIKGIEAMLKVMNIHSNIPRFVGITKYECEY